MQLERFNEILKKQQTRGFDKYVLAPFLIYVGIKYRKLPKRIRRMLVGAGVFQFFYAWNDYAKLQEDVVTFLKESQGENYG